MFFSNLERVVPKPVNCKRVQMRSNCESSWSVLSPPLNVHKLLEIAQEGRSARTGAADKRVLALSASTPTRH